MTTHRIPADKVVIEDDPRLKQVEAGWYSFPSNNGRAILHDYSQPLKFFYIPIEPEPKFLEDNYFHYGNIICSLAALESEYCHFNPDDTLIFLGEWARAIQKGNTGNWFNVLLKNLDKTKYRFLSDPASTMPPELDSQCQQYNVIKVLGVEERVETMSGLVDGMKTSFFTGKILHWKLLGDLLNVDS